MLESAFNSPTYCFIHFLLQEKKNTAKIEAGDGRQGKRQGDLGALWAALTLMISDLYQTNSQIFNPLCSSPLSFPSIVSRALLHTIIWLELAFTTFFHYLPPLTSCLMFLAFFVCFPSTHLHLFSSYFCLFSFSLSLSFFWCMF